MNEITRSIIPRGVVRDAPFLNAIDENGYAIFTPAEIALAYKRVRRWEIIGSGMRIDGGAGLRVVTYSFGPIAYTANTRRSGVFDPAFNIDVPAHSTPETELDLTRTYGTDDLQIYTIGSTHYKVSNPDFPDDPDQNFETDEHNIEAVSNLTMFRDNARQWNSRDWLSSTYRTQLEFSTSCPALPGSGDSPSIITGVDPTIWDEPLQSGNPLACRWEFGGLIEPKTSWAACIVDEGGGPRFLEFSGQIVIRPYTGGGGWWGYADRLNKMPKFDVDTGQRIS